MIRETKILISDDTRQIVTMTTVPDHLDLDDLRIENLSPASLLAAAECLYHAGMNVKDPNIRNLVTACLTLLATGSGKILELDGQKSG